MIARACLLFLGLLLAAPCRADGEPPGQEKAVRLELEGGEVLEGRLEGFAERTYRVRLADGKVREVREEEVTRVEFPGQAASARPTAAAVAARVLARAEASGALAERVLGTHWFLVTEESHSSHHQGEKRGPRLSLLRVEVARDADELRLDLELLLAPGNRSDPEVLDLDGNGHPVRFRARVGMDGRLRRVEAFCRGFSLTWALAGTSCRLEGRVRGKGYAAEVPWSEDMLLESFLALVLAPLHDQGVPETFLFRMARPKGADGPETVRRMRPLPGTRAVSGEELRLLEVTEERGGQARQDRVMRLSCATAGGRLVRWEQENHGNASGVQYVAETTLMERIDAARFEALVTEWKAERAPMDPPAEPAAAEPQPDALSLFLVQARGSGALARVAGTRRYVLRAAPGQADRLEELARDDPALAEQARNARVLAGGAAVIEVTTRLEGERLALEVREEMIGDPASPERHLVSWDERGLLLEHSVRRGRPGVTEEEETARRRGAELVLVTRRRALPLEGWPGSEGRVERSSPLEPGHVPERVVAWLLPLLAGSLPERLELAGSSTPGRVDRSLLLVPRMVPAGADRLVLREERHPTPGDDYFPVPEGLAPARALVLTWGQTEQSDGRPVLCAWIDASGAHLGTSLAELGGFFAPRPDEPLVIRAASAEAVAALRQDPAALAAGRLRRRLADEGAACVALDQLHRAQESFRAGDLDHDGELDFAADPGELAKAGLLQRDGALAIGRTPGYRIELVRAAEAPCERWVAVANPEEAGWKSFAITAEGKVLASPSRLEARRDGRAPDGAQPHRGW